jgi:hypothetical protein
MPKITLEYNLPEENEEYRIATNAGKNFSLLIEIEEYARRLRKYDERDKLPKDEVVTTLNQILSDFER